MAHAGQELRRPNDYRLRLVETAAEAGGERLVMEAEYAVRASCRPSTCTRARISGSTCMRLRSRL